MLYIIPTPIGNIRDITLRALDFFGTIDIWLCENTYSFKNILKLYDISYDHKKFYQYTSHQNHKLDQYMDIFANHDVGYVSESGTPGISDPAKELVRLCREHDIAIEVLPGASAVIPAVVISPRDTSRFAFRGFLPQKKGRSTAIDTICTSAYPTYIYESVHRIPKLLSELSDRNFAGKILICRELTKKFEQKLSGTVAEMLDYISTGRLVLKGEFAIGIYPDI